MKNENNTAEMTKSQAKRAARKKEAERLKKQAIREKTIGYLIGAIAILIILAIIVAFVIRIANRVVPSDSYSACLDSNGFIKQTGAADIELPDYNNIIVPFSEVEYTEEELNDRINRELEANTVLNTDDTLVVANGDEISLDYTGKIDGVEFEGGSAQGYNLVIGSGDFIPGFEEQLVNAKVGSTFDINVTFPEDYSEELAGKEAVFSITINGINQVPELNDEYVLSKYSDVASTVEEYKQYIIDTNYDSNLSTWIENYIDDNSVVTRFDKKYLKNLKAVLKYEDIDEYEYMNEMYQSILGYNYYDSFEDYAGMSETEYDKSLDDNARDTYKNNLAYQSIFELEGCSIDDADIRTSMNITEGDEETYASQVEKYGEPYIRQNAIKRKVIELIKTKVTVQ